MAEVVFLSDLVTKRGSSRYMGPYVLATHLEKAGFDTVVIDWFTEIPDFFSYLRQFLGPETKMVGLSSTFLQPSDSHDEVYQSEQMYWRGILHCERGSEFREWTKQLRSILNEYNPKAKIVIGGAKSMFGHDQIDDEGSPFTEIDYFILGTADRAVVRFCETLRNGDQPPFLIHQGLTIYLNKDDLLPGSSCPETIFTHKHAVARGEALPIEISRGCIYNCKFCRYDKKESIRKPLETLRSEFVRNYETFGTQVYMFSDDCFNDSRPKVESVCEMLLTLPFKIDWVSYARVDVACKFPHTLDLMIESGARALHWGLESFDAKAAKSAGKGTPPDQVKAMLIAMKEKHGDRCLSEGSFITGLPYETEDSLKQTLDWVLNSGAIDMPIFFPLGLHPYNASLDQTVIDFDEYSRNPAKYGFTKISFEPYWWEHELMNSARAAELADEMKFAWRDAGRRGFTTHIWDYPHLRSYGYSHEDVVKFFKDPAHGVQLRDEVVRRRKTMLDRYWTRLGENYRTANLRLASEHPPC